MKRGMILNSTGSASAESLLKGAVAIRVATLVKIAAKVAIPVVPVLIQLTSWNGIHRVPGSSAEFDVIYVWAALTVFVMAYEVYDKGRKSVEWLTYWSIRGRLLSGNLEEIGCYLVNRNQDGRRPSLERIAAGVLEEIAVIVTDLTQPPDGVHIMSCMLVPIAESGEVNALQATVYNENASRSFSLIPLTAPGPVSEAYRQGRPAVVADTSVEPYKEQFEDRPYRSVMAFPVSIGRALGAKIAVVTIDATEANFFTRDVLEEKGIRDAIHPYLTLIGLLRVAEMRGGNRARS